MVDDFDRSIGDEATFAGAAKRRLASEVSIGDERTLGDNISGQDTVIDDIEVVDLEARYRVEGTLGQGGMGAVVLATDTRLERKVAIKRILGEAARSRTAVNRFLTEAKSIAALNHPNIVQIYDYGRAADGPFLIMEYVDGSSLLDRCRGEAIPLDEAVELACQLCDGLAKAHDLGIIHRDIKPANVLLTKDGTPKLTDFGLAKAEANDHGQTMTGAVLGTPDFMPPEQRRDSSLVDARSDLWSLAATVYQMVTGKSPKIIRFDLLPAELTKVLGKALEDEKDARYQTVREFRDALKVSLRAAETPAAVSLGEGQCPGCGTKNDSSRKFCRNCGDSLEAPCLSCDKGMPYWEEICGQCGTKQEPLIAERRSAMAARQAEAESFLNDLDFEAANRIAVALHGEKDPRFNQLTGWAETFLPRIQRSRDEQRIRATALLTEALRHEQAFDYLSTIHALEQVPETLRSEILPECDTSVANVLRRVMAKQADCERLEAKIKSAITARELGSLMPDVESFLRLKPDRKDIQKVKAQLEERHAKLVTQRDDAIAHAKGLIDKHEYPAAVAALMVIDRSVENVECGKVRERAEALLRQVQQLRGKIKQAVAEKRLDGLLADVDVLLQLLPGNAEAQKLRESLIAREAKVEADLAGLRKNVDAAWQACRFADVVKGLERIQEGRRNAGEVTQLDAARDLATWQILVRSATAEASDLDSFATAIRQGRQYRTMLDEHTLEDHDAREQVVRCEREYARLQEEREKDERLQRRMRIVIASGIVAAILIGLIAAGVRVRSSLRAASVQFALQQGDWQAVLKLDPDHVAATIGLAKTQLATQPPDIEKALATLKRAEQLDPTASELKTVSAAAYSARATALAQRDRLTEAAQDLSKAIALDSSNKAVAVCRNAIADAWLSRAARALEKKETAAVQVACDAATKAGAAAERIGPIRAQALLIDSSAYASSKKYSLAVAAMEQATALDSSLGLKTERASLHVGLGEEAASKQDFETAAKELDTAIALDHSVAGASELAALIAEWAVAAFEGDANASTQSASLAAVEAFRTLAPNSKDLQSFRRRVAIGLVKRGEAAVAADPDEGLNYYRLALAQGASEKEVQHLRESLVPALAMRCRQALREQNAQKAADFYSTIAKLDAKSATELRAELDSLPQTMRQAFLSLIEPSYLVYRQGEEFVYLDLDTRQRQTVTFKGKVDRFDVNNRTGEIAIASSQAEGQPIGIWKCSLHSPSPTKMQTSGVGLIPQAIAVDNQTGNFFVSPHALKKNSPPGGLQLVTSAGVVSNLPINPFYVPDMQVDAANSWVYYSTYPSWGGNPVGYSGIRRIRTDGESDQEVYDTKGGSCFALARNGSVIYFSSGSLHLDANTGREIMQLFLDTRKTVPVIKEALGKVEDVEVCEHKHKLIWTVRCPTSNSLWIRWADMDGSNDETLCELDRNGIGYIGVWEPEPSHAGKTIEQKPAELNGVDPQTVPLPVMPDDAGSVDADAPGKFTTTPTGLKYRILRKGRGGNPRASDTVKVRYHGWLDDGRVVDSSYSQGESIEFRLNGVFPGWTEGLQLVAEGGMIELEIPSDLGYGSRGTPGGPIPRNATLHFLVELLEVK